MAKVDPETGLKYCPSCKKYKMATDKETEFDRDSIKLDGWHTNCKECRKKSKLEKDYQEEATMLIGYISDGTEDGNIIGKVAKMVRDGYEHRTSVDIVIQEAGWSVEMFWKRLRKKMRSGGSTRMKLKRWVCSMVRNR